jgi:hypothetical protein
MEPWPSDAAPAWLALFRAENTAAGLQLVADRRGTTIAELRRGLTRRELEEEIARAVVDLGRDIGRAAFFAKEAPPEGDDLVSRVARAYHGRLTAAQEAREEEESDRALERQLDT